MKGLIDIETKKILPWDELQHHNEEPCQVRWQPFKATLPSLIMHRQARKLFPIVFLIEKVSFLSALNYLSYLVTKIGAVCR